MTARDLAQLINDEIDRIWLEEPLECKRLRQGIIPTGAGSGGQYFSTQVFALTYTLTLGEHLLFDLLKVANDSSISLDLPLTTKSDCLPWSALRRFGVRN